MRRTAFTTKIKFDTLPLPFSAIYWNESNYSQSTDLCVSPVHSTHKYVKISNHKISNAFINFKSVTTYE